jgi:hypothetical protein
MKNRSFISLIKRGKIERINFVISLFVVGLLLFAIYALGRTMEALYFSFFLGTFLTTSLIFFRARDIGKSFLIYLAGFVFVFENIAALFYIMPITQTVSDDFWGYTVVDCFLIVQNYSINFVLLLALIIIFIPSKKIEENL